MLKSWLFAICASSIIHLVCSLPHLPNKVLYNLCFLFIYLFLLSCPRRNWRKLCKLRNVKKLAVRHLRIVHNTPCLFPPPPPPTKFFITFVFLFLLNFSFFPGKIEDNYAKFEGEGANKMHYEVQIANKSEVSELELSLSIRCRWYSNLWLNCQTFFSLQAFQSYLVLPPTDRNFKDHIWPSGFPKLASKMKSFEYNKTCFLSNSKTCTFLG